MVKRATKMRSRADVLRKVFASPRYLAAMALAAAAYYALYFYVTRYGAMGMQFSTVPVYAVYALIASSAVLAALSVYVLAESFRVLPAGVDGAVSACTAGVGFVIAGCGCEAPLLSSLLYLAGMGAVQVSGVISLVGDFQSWLILLMIVINLAFIYHQSGRMARKVRARARRG